MWSSSKQRSSVKIPSEVLSPPVPKEYVNGKCEASKASVSTSQPNGNNYNFSNWFSATVGASVAECLNVFSLNFILDGTTRRPAVVVLYHFTHGLTPSHSIFAQNMFRCFSSRVGHVFDLCVSEFRMAKTNAKLGGETKSIWYKTICFTCSPQVEDICEKKKWQN